MSKVILFQGDSITDCGRDRTDPGHSGRGYAFMVKSRLGSQNPGEYTFYNRGIGGNRIVDVYARIKSDIINLKPDYMSLLIGVNDVWHELGGKHNGVSAEKFEKIYDMLLSEIFEALPNVKIMLIEPFVLEGTATAAREEEPDRWENFRREVPRRAAVARRMAEKYSLPCISIQDRLDEACKKAPAEYWLRDGVHPTPMGHWILQEAWLEGFEKLQA